jgi:hypothetical protein
MAAVKELLASYRWVEAAMRLCCLSRGLLGRCWSKARQKVAWSQGVRRC